MNKFKKLSVVVPCYNEEETINIFHKEMEKNKKKIGLELEYIFVDDGSKDNTLNILKKLYNKNKGNIKYISFSRNFGKEAAMLAGLKKSTGDLVTIMDVDLQDPPEIIPEMVKKMKEENLDWVGSKRVTRTGEPPIRSFFDKKFYQIINKISDTEMVDGVRDFRLMKRKVVDAILEVGEYNRFSKGIFSWVGFKKAYISYENRERVAGKTTWSFFKLFKYSLDGIINFSETPLNISLMLGIIICIVSIIALIGIVFKTLVYGNPTSGWASIMCVLLFTGGIQLFCMGILRKICWKDIFRNKEKTYICDI